MADKKDSPHRRSTNAAKARRKEREKAQRAQDIRQLDTQKLKEALEAFTEGIKTKVAQRQQAEISKRFSMPIEDRLGSEYSFAIPAPLSKPNQRMTQQDRIQWFWPIGDLTVVASLIMSDSAYPDDGPARHGSRAGDWTVDVLGRDGGACFAMTPDQAKTLGEAVLSAVYWQFAWQENEKQQ